MVQFSQKIGLCILDKKRHFFAKCFMRIITSVPKEVTNARGRFLKQDSFPELEKPDLNWVVKVVAFFTSFSNLERT
jgi:hypothetical protein